MADPAPPHRSRVQDMDADEFQRWYGPWAAPDPTGVAAIFDGAPFRWWIVGGWSLELGDVPRREHEDIDVGNFGRDIDAVRDWLADYHLWEAHTETLRPLLAGEAMREGREQIWVRRDAYSPWLIDLVLSPSDGDTWIFKRDHRVRMPLDELLRVRPDGIACQRPEVTLLFKAANGRAKDDVDLAATLPVLSAEARDWLRENLALTLPGHAWLDLV